jgi:hypothetical protein
MRYRIAKRFNRVEAMGDFGALGRVNDLQDPATVMVQVTDIEDVNNVIETGYTNLPSSNNILSTNVWTEVFAPAPLTSIPGSSENPPYRAATGIWTYDLQAARYQVGKAYSVSWRYEMTPGNIKIDHFPFRWNPIPIIPQDSANCVISDSWIDMVGIPQADIRVGVEFYVHNYAPGNRRDTAYMKTDMFGNWYIEVKRGSMLRFILGTHARYIIVPDAYNATLSSIPDTQPSDVRKDSFGYPLP